MPAQEHGGHLHVWLAYIILDPLLKLSEHPETCHWHCIECNHTEYEIFAIMNLYGFEQPF